MPRNNEEVTCPNCEETYEIDDMVDIGGDYWCGEDCYETFTSHNSEDNDEGLILPWAFKKRPIFMHENGDFRSAYRSVTKYNGDKIGPELYIGVELETECVSGDRMNGARFVKANTVIKGTETVYLKADGSLDHGFEIVSHPGTMEFFMQDFNWKAISGLKSRGFHAWNASSCGLHLHLSRNAFINDSHLMKFIYFIYKNRIPLVQFAGRESTRYARFDMNMFLNARYDHYEEKTIKGNTLTQMAKGHVMNSERFMAVNLQNTKTIELRFFRPSLNTDTVLAAIQFAQALFEYTKDVNIKEAVSGGLMFDSFNKWTIERSKFHILNQRISERVKERELI